MPPPPEVKIQAGKLIICNKIETYPTVNTCMISSSTCKYSQGRHMCFCKLAGSLSVHGQWEAAERLSDGCSPVKHSSSEYVQWSVGRSGDLGMEIGSLNGYWETR